MKTLTECELQDAIAKMMEQRGKAMLEVPYGQDPYNAIGDYIEDHITAIEDIIATIEVDGIKTNQLLMVDMKPDHYFVWDNDWWEGEENVALIDFFPVSEAQKPSAQPDLQWIPCSERLPEDGSWNIFTDGKNMSVERYKKDAIDHFFPNGRWFEFDDAIAWMPLPEPYQEEKE